MRCAARDLCPTTIMTGNLTQAILDLVELAGAGLERGDGAEPGRVAAAQRLRRSGIPVVSFVLGAFLGATVTRAVGLSGVALPTFASGLLAVASWRGAHEREARARQRLSIQT
jgi:uncharacterized membrane protein YoaK (UPF0700 family)